MDRASSDWESLKSAGVDLAAAALKLEEEGVKSFAKSFETLMGVACAARKSWLPRQGEAFVDKGLAEALKALLLGARLWEKDASLWKEEKAHQQIIRNALGWLTGPKGFSGRGLGADSNT